MTTKFQSDKGTISLSADTDHRFPIYFCLDCGAPNSAFGIARADGRLNYCGWVNGRPACVGKGRTADGGKAAAYHVLAVGNR